MLKFTYERSKKKYRLRLTMKKFPKRLRRWLGRILFAASAGAWMHWCTSHSSSSCFPVEQSTHTIPIWNVLKGR
jgi:hypothetical protein